jgi:cytochrome P450
MCSAILALVTHPTAIQAAQAELYHVVGFDRTPTFEDEARLPYMRALCKEVLRWRPVAVLGGTPHASTEDDVYQGWRIPAGTTILGNSWAINLNEEYYPNPQLFNPSRFLDEKDPRFVAVLKGTKVHPAKAGHSSFGWGRRICPGADLAANSLFIALSKLIWSFDILPTRRYDTFDYTDGFNIRPRPFQCQILVRSEVQKQVLEKEMKEAEKYMAKFPAYE